MIRITLLLAALMVPIAARADDRPLPVPSRGSVCPAGFSFSPTSGYCTPNPGTKAQALPKQGYQACPPGYAESIGTYCVEAGPR
jgi:hypothetical protein